MVPLSINRKKKKFAFSGKHRFFLLPLKEEEDNCVLQGSLSSSFSQENSCSSPKHALKDQVRGSMQKKKNIFLFIRYLSAILVLPAY